MFTKKVATSVIALSLIAASPLAALSAHAAQAQNQKDQNDPTVSATQNQGQDSQDQKADAQFMKVSQEGYDAMRDVRGARLAIFYGQPDMATKLVADAKNAIASAKGDAASLDQLLAAKGGSSDQQSPSQSASASQSGGSSGTSGQQGGSDQQTAFIPVDAQMMVNDNFVVTPDKQAAVSQANKHLKSGDSKQAMDALKLADVNIDVAFAMIPADGAAKTIDQADGLMQQHKYYEASQALKSVEDMVQVEVTDANFVPKAMDQQQKTGANDTQNQSAPKSKS